MFHRSLLVLVLCTAPAFAEHAADKSVGVGLGVGVATGPNLQVMTSGVSHLDIGMGFQLDDRVRVQADHAWRLMNLSRSSSVSLPLYLGVGGFLSDRRADVATVGARMPVGLQLDFAKAPVQVFGEVAPELAVVHVVDDNMDAPGHLSLTGLMGVRATF